MQAQTRSEYHSVLADYPDMAGARAAIDALEFAGIDAGHISLDGALARQAAARTPTNTARRDVGLVEHIAGRAIAGIVLGGVAGSVLGVIIGNLGISWLGTSVPTTMATWGVGGVLVGMLVGAYSAISAGDEWELTFEPSIPGEVIVAVHSESGREIARAATVLTQHRALRISKF
jgi:hypothetical protein